MRCTIGSKQKTQYQTYDRALKMSFCFRQAGDSKRYILNSNGKPSRGGHTQTTMQTVKSMQSYQRTTQINSGQIKQLIDVNSLVEGSATGMQARA
jgi:hypothetical protein